MTTDAHASPRVPLAGMALALLLWFGGVAVLALLFDPERAVVWGPSDATAAALEQAGALPLVAGRGFVVVRTTGAGTVRRLYRAGAWFVWPALRGGCA